MMIDNKFAAIALIEVLYKKGLINQETYRNVLNYSCQVCESESPHISQVA